MTIATTRRFWTSLLGWTGGLLLLHIAAVVPGRVFGLWNSLSSSAYLGVSAIPSVLADIPVVVGFLLPFTALAAGASIVTERSARNSGDPWVWIWSGVLVMAVTFVIHSYVAPIANWWVFRSFYATPAEAFPYGPWTPVALWTALQSGGELQGIAAMAADPEWMKLTLHRAFAHPALSFAMVGLGYHLRRAAWRRHGPESRRGVWTIGLVLCAVLMYPYYLTGTGQGVAGPLQGLIAWLPLWVTLPPLLVFLWTVPSTRKVVVEAAS